MKDRLLASLGKLRWGALALAALFVLVTVGVLVALAANPPEKYRAKIETTLRQTLAAKKADFKTLKWAFSLRDLSVGVQAEDLVIEGAGPLQSLYFPSLTVSTQPLKAILGKMPIKISGRGKQISLGFKPKDLKGAEAASGGESVRSVPVPLPRWIAYLRADLDLTVDEIAADPSSMGFASGSSLKLKQTSLKATISGVPGYFKSTFESDLDVDLSRPEWSGRGPIKVSTDGYFQLAEDKPVGLKVQSLILDLNESTITGLGLIEKPSTIPLEVNTSLQLLLAPDLTVKSIEVQRGHILYDMLRLDLSGTAMNEGKTLIKWALANTEVQKLRLPISSVRNVPMEGVIEASGQFQFLPEGLESGLWRVALNNIRFNSADIRRDDPEASGKVNLSFMSEGSIEGGRISSPRTELQFDGTEAELNFFSGRFRKPSGKPLQFIAKVVVDHDKLSLTELAATFHTMQLKGSGEVEDVSAYLAGESTPFRLSLFSNRIDLSKYSAFLPLFRRPPPLEGFLEVSGSVDGPLKKNSFSTDELQWRITRMNLSGFNAIFDRESLIQFGFENNDYLLTGAMNAGFLFQGRGRGTVVDRASLSSQVDLTQSALTYKNHFRKSVGIPLSLDISAEQSRQSLKITRGLLRLHDLGLLFDGAIAQGSNRSFIDLKMPRPILLSNWKSLLIDSSNLPLDGKIAWKGRIGFKSSGPFEANLDWKTLSVEGNLNVSDLSGRFGDFKNSVRNGSAQVILTSDAVTVPSLMFQMGGSRVGATGKLEFPANAHGVRNKGNLARLMTREGWDMNAAVTMSRVNLDDFETFPVKSTVALPSNMKAEEGPTLGQRIKDALDSEFAKSGRFKMTFRSPEAVFNRLAISDLNARVVWENGILQLQPAGARIFNGNLTGSASFNAEKFYARKEAPELSVSVKADGADVNLMALYFSPEMAKLIGGTFKGQVTAATQGFEAEEFAKNLKGRMSGSMRDASFETLEVLGKAIDNFISNSAAKDYLMGQAAKEGCLQRKFAADVDMQLASTGVKFESAALRFETGSSLEFKGQLTKDLAVDMDGNFFAGPRCIGGDARACILDEQNRAALPFKIHGAAMHPEVDADLNTIARRIVACAVKKVAARATDAVKKEAQKQIERNANDLEEKAKSAFKNLIKGP